MFKRWVEYYLVFGQATGSFPKGAPVPTYRNQRDRIVGYHLPHIQPISVESPEPQIALSTVRSNPRVRKKHQVPPRMCDTNTEEGHYNCKEL